MNDKPITGRKYRILSKYPPRLHDQVGIARQVDPCGATWQVCLEVGAESLAYLATELEPVNVPTSPLGITITTPGAAEDAADNSESAEGRRFVRALETLALEFPFAADVYHIPNGGGRTKIAGYLLKQEGVRPGILDYALDLPKFDGAQLRAWHGWRGELKRATGGAVSDEQRQQVALLNARGYWAEVHIGHEAMLRDLRRYLSLLAINDAERTVG